MLRSRTPLLVLLLIAGVAALWTALAHTPPVEPVQAQSCVVPPDGMISWWPGDGNADDIVGGNHGTLVGGGAFGTGMVGQAFNLDGVDDYVGLPAFDSPTSLNDFTADAWFFMDDHNSEGRSYILDLRGDDSTTEDSIYLIIDLDGGQSEIHHGMAFASGGFAEFDTPIASPTDGWHHTALVREGSTFRAYFDGDQVASVFTPQSVFKDDPANLTNGGRIGTWSGATPGGIYWLNGLIDEVEIFDRALTAEEIQDIFNAGSAGKCKGLLLAAPTPGTAGEVNTFSVSGATIGATVHFIGGVNAGSIAVPGCTGQTVEIGSPKVLGTAMADGSGNASLVLPIPAGADGVTVRLQAVEGANCLVSNLVVHTFSGP